MNAGAVCHEHVGAIWHERSSTNRGVRRLLFEFLVFVARAHVPTFGVIGTHW